jgi:hypothetical protein
LGRRAAGLTIGPGRLEVPVQSHWLSTIRQLSSDPMLRIAPQPSGKLS